METSSKNLTKAFARKNSSRSFGGFTIIEVLIVLAIAGLIMAIVFLAVPALQRNSRNTALRNDAANVLSGVNEFVANNQGQLPTIIGPTAANGDVPISSSVAGTQPTTAKVRTGVLTSVSCTMPTATSLGQVVICLNQRCTGSAFAGTATQRAFAAGFRVEVASGTNPTQCIEG